VPPWFQRERIRRGKDDKAGPLVIEMPLLSLRLVWRILRIVAYVALVAGRTVALPFRSAARTRSTRINPQSGDWVKPGSTR
jgi:hypothetical protein